MVGDAGVGKTSLMVRYVSGGFEESYVESLGVSFLEKRIRLPDAEVVMAIWDLAGGREHRAMLPTACAEALVILFVFDLTDVRSLRAVRDWFKLVRKSNPTARPLLVGTKFDAFHTKSPEFKADVTQRARKYAGIMGAPLVFSSALRVINVKKLFRLVFHMAFGLPPNLKQMTDVGTPILEYDRVISVPKENAGGRRGARRTSAREAAADEEAAAMEAAVAAEASARVGGEGEASLGAGTDGPAAAPGPAAPDAGMEEEAAPAGGGDGAASEGGREADRAKEEGVVAEEGTAAK